MFRQSLKKPLIALGLLAATGPILSYAIINYFPASLPSWLVELARKPELLQFPDAKRCSECHTEIHKAWQKSRHSQAWISETYIRDSKDRSKEKCLPCHIPTRVVAGTKPEPRLNHRDDGIYCVPCHVRDRAMHGPYALFSPPHPTQEDKTYRSGKFCGSCHEKTFKEWQAAGVDQTCQACHMARRKDRLTQKFPLNLLHRKREVADHSFPHREITKENFKLEAAFGPANISVRLLNQSIPLHVPTADNGDPRLFLDVILHNADGEEWDRFKEILAPQQESAIPYKQTVQFHFPVPETVQRAEILLRYKPAWSKEKTEIRRLEVAR